MTSDVSDFLVTALFYLLVLLPAFIVGWLLEPIVGRDAAHIWGTLVLVLSIVAAAFLGRRYRARKSRHGRD
jgi:membrane protein implicated in regulation of membrane protease activity